MPDTVRRDAGRSCQDGEDGNVMDGKPPDSMRMGNAEEASGRR